MTEIKDYIKDALERDVDLSREEYAEKQKKADEITAAHGVEGEAPLSEEERERRMRMNFYGSTLNVMMALYSAVEQLNNGVAAIASMLTNGGTNNGNE